MGMPPAHVLQRVRHLMAEPVAGVQRQHLVDDDPEGPTKKAEQRVIAFFKQRTGA